MKLAVLLCLFLAAISALAADQPFLESELIFPLGTLHSHSSSIVQLPTGDLYVCWYKGSGERTADDVLIEASLRRSVELFFMKGYRLSCASNRLCVDDRHSITR